MYVGEFQGKEWVISGGWGKPVDDLDAAWQWVKVGRSGGPTDLDRKLLRFGGVAMILSRCGSSILCWLRTRSMISSNPRLRLAGYL